MPSSLPFLPKFLRLAVLTAVTVLAALAFAADSRAVMVGAGAGHSCAITPRGALVCWGSDQNVGALGTGEDRAEASYDPLLVKGLGSGVTDVALSSNATSCAVVSGGARCWGNNSYGQFGNGTRGTESNTPLQVSGLESGVTKISVNAANTCAIHNGAGKCWGEGGDGRLGYGSTTDQSTPVTATGLESGVTDIATGWRHACAIKDGTIMCWGANTNGQLGYGGTYPQNRAYAPYPLASPPPGRAVRIAAGSEFNCALMDSGAVYCWGSNNAGRLGAGSTASSSTDPLQVVGMDSGVTAISANSGHACAIKSGTAFCWGGGNSGKLGNGATDDSNVPVQARNIGGVTSIAAGHQTTCAVASGKYYCWGTNSSRQLGTDKVGSYSAVPVQVTGTTPPPPPPVATITTPDGPSKLSRSGIARLATVSCPAGATCAVAAPGRVKVTIRNKVFRVKVLGAGPVPAGGRVRIRTSFGKAARARLGSRTTTVKVKLTTTVNGAQRAQTIRVKVKGRG